MPFFEYKCPKCNHVFEELVKKYDDNVNCPLCGELAVRNYSGKIYTQTGQTVNHCTGDCKNCKGCGK